MREAISEEHVEEVFRVAFHCLEWCRSVYAAWEAVYADDEVRAGLAKSGVAREKVAALVSGIRELKSAHERLAIQLQPFAWVLPALVEGAIRNSGVTASSWTEGVVKLGESLTGELVDWERLADLDEKRRRDLVNAVFRMTAEFGHPPDFDLFDANVRVEAAKMRERARAETPEVRYAYELLHLTPQSRRLFKLLTERQGRVVEYQTIAEIVIDDPRATNARIQKAMSRLKDELNGFGSTEIAGAIASEEGAYRLR